MKACGRLLSSRDSLFTGSTSRRELFRVATALGVGGTLLGTGRPRFSLAATGEPLVIPTDTWIRDFHPLIAEIDRELAATLPVSVDMTFNYDIMVLDAANGTSVWDAYIGATPFFELIQFIEAGAIEPWDPYLPAGYLDDLPRAIRAEGTYDGKFYIWPVLLDVVVQSWNGAILEKAGVDPSNLPKDWDTFISTAAAIQSSGAATYGCSFDVTPWRSLIPIALSLSAEVFNDDGTFAWAGAAAIESLEIMRRMTELSQPGAGAAGTFMDPGPFFALEDAASLVTFVSAALLQTATWEDPSRFTVASLPTTAERGGGSIFWDTGAVLFKYGQHKVEAANYLQAITTDQRVWQAAIAGSAGVTGTASGKLPPSSSIWNEYIANPPAWLTDSPWALTSWNAMETATFIPPTKLGFDQFTIALPFYTAYLIGEEKDAKAALERAQDAVAAAMKV
jgi:hypothetical protein